MTKSDNDKEFGMTQAMQWYIELTDKIFEGIGAHTNPEIGKFIENIEGLEGPDIGFLQIGYAYAPDPLTVQSYIARGPYAAPETYENQMDEAVERGWLEKVEDGQYKLSEKGRKTVDHFFEMGNQLFSELPSLPADESRRIVDLLAKVVEYAYDLTEPASKATMEIGIRLNPGEDAAPMLRIRRHLTDLNYYREDAHIAAWQLLYNLDGRLFETLTLLWRGQAANPAELAEQLSQYRGYDEDDYRAALEELVKRGWAAVENEQYMITDQGKKTRQEAEDVTDQYFYTAFDVLSKEEVGEFKTLLEKLAETVAPPKEEAEST
jgi:predicted transcriptional regulator